MKTKNKKIQDEEWVEMLLSLESCEEAIEIFEDMIQCPVCGAQINDGVIRHKSKEEYVN